MKREIDADNNLSKCRLHLKSLKLKRFQYICMTLKYIYTVNTLIFHKVMRTVTIITIATDKETLIIRKAFLVDLYADTNDMILIPVILLSKLIWLLYRYVSRSRTRYRPKTWNQMAIYNYLLVMAPPRRIVRYSPF